METYLAAHPDSESETLDACRRGDREAQRWFYDRYRTRVFSIALHYLRGDEAGAEDVTQEVFVKVFRSLSRFEAAARISTWLYRIVVNACHDELRRRRRLVFIGDTPNVDNLTVDPHDPMWEAEEIGRAVHALAPKFRMVVLLRYFEDLSYDQIAEVLDTSAGTVASRLHRAHAALSQTLKHLNKRTEG